MSEELDWLARNVSEWDGRFDMACKPEGSRTIGAEWFNSKYFSGKRGYTCDQWQARRKELGLIKWCGPQDGLPPVGAEFEWSLNSSCFSAGTMLFNDGITLLIADRQYPANRWHYKCDDPGLRFRVLPTKEERDIDAMLKFVNQDYETLSAKVLTSPQEYVRDAVAQIYRALQSGKLKIVIADDGEAS